MTVRSSRPPGPAIGPVPKPRGGASPTTVSEDPSLMSELAKRPRLPARAHRSHSASGCLRTTSSVIHPLLELLDVLVHQMRLKPPALQLEVVLLPTLFAGDTQVVAVQSLHVRKRGIRTTDQRLDVSRHVRHLLRTGRS